MSANRMFYYYNYKTLGYLKILRLHIAWQNIKIHGKANILDRELIIRNWQFMFKYSTHSS